MMEKISTQLEEECLIRQSWSKQNRMSWGAWEAQLLEHTTLDFGSGHDLRVVRSSLCQSPHLAGNLLEMVSSLPLLLPWHVLSVSLSLSFSKIKKSKKIEQDILRPSELPGTGISR